MESLKKYGTYSAVLVFGFFLGYLIFGNLETPLDLKSSTTSTEPDNFICSMHPEVNQKERGVCPVCGMDLVEMNLYEDDEYSNRFQLTDNAISLANVETITVGVRGKENNFLKLSGKITSNERTNATQTSIFDGRIEKLSVNYFGAKIRKGQQIGMIYTPDLYDAQDKLLSVSTYKEGTHKKIYDAARNAYGLWRMTDEQIDQVIQTGKPIVNFPLIADVSGTVTDLIASEGSFYKQGDPLFKVSNLSTVWAVFEAYENQLKVLKVGEIVKISVKSFPGKTFEAKISFIEPVLNDTKRTALVRVNLNNKDRLLKPGMFIEGQIEIKGGVEQITVPNSAVLWTGKRSVVYKKPITDKPIFEMTEVLLGDRLGDSFVVMNGLSEGDEVVVNGTFTVDAAAQLQGKKSMMNSRDSAIKMNGEKEIVAFDPMVEKTFKKIISNYIDLKDALITTDLDNTILQALKLVEELDSLQSDLLSSDILEHIDTIKENAKLISESSEINIKRNRFKQLSESMIRVTSYFTEWDYPIYVQYCPMADNGKGGNWLSLEDEIRNPYFGNKMLTCGKVIHTIQ